MRSLLSAQLGFGRSRGSDRTPLHSLANIGFERPAIVARCGKSRKCAYPSHQP
jgi:hypothetical protein